MCQGYIHEYTGGCSAHGRDFISTSGSYHEYIEGHHDSYQGDGHHEHIA